MSHTQVWAAGLFGALLGNLGVVGLQFANGAEVRYFAQVTTTNGKSAVTCAAVKFRDAESLVASVKVTHEDAAKPTQMHYRYFRPTSAFGPGVYVSVRKDTGLPLRVRFKPGHMIFSYEQPWVAKQTSERKWRELCRD